MENMDKEHTGEGPELSEFEKLCLNSQLSADSIGKLHSNGITSVPLLKLLKKEHIRTACGDWSLGQALALEALIDMLHITPAHRDASRVSQPGQHTASHSSASTSTTSCTQVGMPAPAPTVTMQQQMMSGVPGLHVPPGSSALDLPPHANFPRSVQQPLQQQGDRPPWIGHQLQQQSQHLPAYQDIGHPGPAPMTAWSATAPPPLIRGGTNQPAHLPVNIQGQLPVNMDLPHPHVSHRPLNSQNIVAGNQRNGPQDLMNLLGQRHDAQRQTAVLNPIDDPTVHLLPQQHRIQGEKPLLITDFASDLGAAYDQGSEHVLSEHNGHSVVVKSSSGKKLKLENISPAQWISANARIMAELLCQGKLLTHQIPYYLSYTAKIGDLALRYTWQSVLLYDNEYRHLQVQFKFDWGRDTPHLTTTYLREKQTSSNPSAKSQPNKASTSFCRNFNSKGCSFTGCTYKHVCSEPGCGQPHPKTEHGKANK